MKTPCEDRPEDWFIGRDGKQYSDDEFLNEDDLLAILESVNDEGLQGDERIAAIEKAQDRLEADRKRAALQRRRHAKEDCYVCPLRTLCLGLAIERQEPFGTWGGYYEEEIRQIVVEKRARDKRPF